MKLLALLLLASTASADPVLFSNGFEVRPWDAMWGMKWGPSPKEHASIVEEAGGHALRVCYKAGAVGPKAGLQFLSEFSRMGMAPQESAYLRYKLRFDPGFDFVKGGKLPGFAGGDANTGGRKPDGRDGWSARIMWRKGGEIVQYIYHPDQEGDFGQDFAWSRHGTPCHFKPGSWQSVETYLKMNTPGKHDGVLRCWLDGVLVLENKTLRFRDTPDLKIDLFYFSTFFGGSGLDWASPKDQFVEFDDFIISKTRIGSSR